MGEIKKEEENPPFDAGHPPCLTGVVGVVLNLYISSPLGTAPPQRSIWMVRLRRKRGRGGEGKRFRGRVQLVCSSRPAFRALDGLSSFPRRRGQPLFEQIAGGHLQRRAAQRHVVSGEARAPTPRGHASRTGIIHSGAGGTPERGGRRSRCSRLRLRTRGCNSMPAGPAAAPARTPAARAVPEKVRNMPA